MGWRHLKTIGLIVVGLAMWLLGVSLHLACAQGPVNASNWVSIVGYDSEIYLTRFSSLQGVLFTSLRHPLMYVFAAPLALLSTPIVHCMGPEAAYMLIFAFFAAVGALGLMLMWQILHRLSSGRMVLISSFALWLSFAHVWLLGGLAESFSLSLVMMLGLIWTCLRGVKDARFWCGASLLCGGITLTNGIKPLLVWLLTEKGGACRKLGYALGFSLLVAVGLVAALVFKWGVLDHRDVVVAAQNMWGLLSHDIPGANVTMGQRMLYLWQAFWCEPMMLHGRIIGVDAVNPHYSSWIPHGVGVCVLGLCLVSVIHNRRHPLIRVMMGMLVVDVLLHLVLEWGILEGQVYCGHWFWCIPVLVSMLPKALALAGLPLAFVILAHNLGVALNVGIF